MATSPLSSYGHIAAVELLTAGPDDSLIEQGKAHFSRRSGESFDGFEVWDGARRVYGHPEGVSADQLKQAVEDQHGCKATLFYVAHVLELFGRKMVWDGHVHVFDLTGHPKATRAYAWAFAGDSNTKHGIFAILHLGAVASPADAVRAAILAK